MNSQVIQEFLDYSKSEGRSSEQAVKCFGADLMSFGNFLLKKTKSESETSFNQAIDGLLLCAGADSVQAFLAFLNDKQYSKATIARKLATLRSFYEFLVKRNQITTNPVVARRK